jgi:hypothetical protein
MIPAREIRDWADEELKERREKLIKMIRGAMGSHYPNIWGGEIGQIDKELQRRKPKTIYVSWDDETDADYKFEIETSRGRRRVLPKGCYPGELVCRSSDEIRLWLKKLKVTHVVTKFDCKKTDESCIKDGKYTVAQYTNWWKRAEEDD